MKLLAYLKNFSIEFSLSELNLSVGGSLYLRGTAITELPDNLSVGGSLYLEGTAITELPDNLSVGGSLDLRGTAITELPDNLSVGGSLYLEGAAITELPDNLSVGGSLDLRGTAITELPDNLSVGGSLYLRGTAITNVSYKDNCGSSERTIFAVKLCGEFKISAGCFFGSQKVFNERVDADYFGEPAKKYKLDAAECILNLTEKLNINAAA